MSSITSMKPHKSNTRTTPLKRTNQNESVSSSTLPNSYKRNKFEHTPKVTSSISIQQHDKDPTSLSYTIIDLQRLLHVMETTTPSLSLSNNNNNNTAPSTTITASWQDYEIRCSLLQDMYESLLSASSSSLEEDTKNRKKLLYELEPRIDKIVKATEQYIIQLKQQQKEQQPSASKLQSSNGIRNNNSSNHQIDVMEQLFPTTSTTAHQEDVDKHITDIRNISNRMTRATRNSNHTNSINHNVTNQNNSIVLSSSNDLVALPPPSKTNTKSKENNNTSNNNNTNTNIQQIQEQQQQQMEDALIQMANQMKTQTLLMNEQITKQNIHLLDTIQTTIENNVNDVTNITQLTKQHLQQNWYRTYSTWTMMILIIITFIGTIGIILIVPKNNTTSRTYYFTNTKQFYTKYIQPSFNNQDNKNGKNNDQEICRLLPSGIQECYVPIQHNNNKNDDNEITNDNTINSNDDAESELKQNGEDTTTTTTTTSTTTDDSTTTAISTEQETDLIDDQQQQIQSESESVPENVENTQNDDIDIATIYRTMVSDAIRGSTMDMLYEQYIQHHPTLIYYTDGNGWGLIHELVRTITNVNRSYTIEDHNRIYTIVQYFIQYNTSIVYIQNNIGDTPYDIYIKSLSLLSIEQQHEQHYQSMKHLLQNAMGITTTTTEQEEEATNNERTIITSINDDENDINSNNNDNDIVETIVSDHIQNDESHIIDNTEPISDVHQSDNTVDDISKMEQDNVEVEQNKVEGEAEEEVENEDEDHIEPTIYDYAKHAIAFNDIQQLHTLLNEHPIELLHNAINENDGTTLLHYAIQFHDSYECIQIMINTYHDIVYMTSYGTVNDETGEIIVPPQTPYDMAIALYDEHHPIVTTLQEAMGIISQPDEVSQEYTQDVVHDDHHDEEEVENNDNMEDEVVYDDDDDDNEDYDHYEGDEDYFGDRQQEEEHYNDDEEVVEEDQDEEYDEECEIDIATGLCIDDHNTNLHDNNIINNLQIPTRDSDDILQDALREFDEMQKKG